MPPFHLTRQDPTPETETAELWTEDDATYETGRLRLTYRYSTLEQDLPCSFIVENKPRIHLGVRVKPKHRELIAVIGTFSGGAWGVTAERVCELPAIKTDSGHFVVDIAWREWDIISVRVDDADVVVKQSSSPVKESPWVMSADPNQGSLPPIEGIMHAGSAVPEHEGFMFVMVPPPDAPPGLSWLLKDKLADPQQRIDIYNVQQGNTEISIFRAEGGDFVYNHRNPSFGNRAIRIPFADATTPDTRACSVIASWSTTKNQLVVQLIRSQAGNIDRLASSRGHCMPRSVIH